jgi:xylulose-5-phosphate/fructose-6-phosphate phosphoketolase
MMANLDPNRLRDMNRYWQAANYLTIGQIYLQENPLLREPLRPEHIKPRLLGHWGTSPGLSFIYVHLNRLIQDTDADVIYLTGPGHGGPAPSFPSVLDAGRHPEPRQRHDPRFHS